MSDALHPVLGDPPVGVTADEFAAWVVEWSRFVAGVLSGETR